MSDYSLVYVGKVISLTDIENAHFIRSATVVCGVGGKWTGIVRKDEFTVGDLCVVFLPDSLLNEVDHAHLPFMEKSGWRVKMQKFRGAPSEVLITKYHGELHVGADITELCKVKKYHKPISPHLQGIAKGSFPSFIPKTDELNYQRHWDLVERLVGNPYYITEKCDGSSTTAYKWKGKFGICSRNLELESDENNGYWKVARKYNLEENLPEGIAIQWETCGPKIQGNPMELSEIDGFMFSAYDIEDKCYLCYQDLCNLSKKLNFPMVNVLDVGNSFSLCGIEKLGEGRYDCGRHREGVVVRSQKNFQSSPISFKVINLNYEI